MAFSSVFRIDKVELRPRDTGDRLVAPFTVFDLLLWEIILHIHAPMWAAKDDEIEHEKFGTESATDLDEHQTLLYLLSVPFDQSLSQSFFQEDHGATEPPPLFSSTETVVGNGSRRRACT